MKASAEVFQDPVSHLIRDQCVGFSIWMIVQRCYPERDFRAVISQTIDPIQDRHVLWCQYFLDSLMSCREGVIVVDLVQLRKDRPTLTPCRRAITKNLAKGLVSRMHAKAKLANKNDELGRRQNYTFTFAGPRIADPDDYVIRADGPLRNVLQPATTLSLGESTPLFGLSWMVFALGMVFQLFTVEVNLTQIPCAIPLSLIIEVL